MTKLKEKKKATKKQKTIGCLAWVIAIPLIIVACNSGGDDTKPKETTQPKTEQQAKPKAEPKAEAKTTAPAPKTWEEGIKQIAASNKSTTEKYDATMQLAKQFPTTGNEQLFDYTQQLMTEVDSQKYLANPKDDVYMLTNIYKSAVIVNASSDGSAGGDFAFDFLQNTKYVYRGVDAPDSQAVKANEEQMHKSAEKMLQIINANN